MRISCLLLLLPLWAANLAAAENCLAPPYAAGLNTQLDVIAAYPRLPGLPRLLQLVRPPTSSDYWYAVSQLGKIWRFHDKADSDALELVLDWSQRIESFGEAGLLGLAFHPDFHRNATAYIYYSPSAQLSRLSQIQLQAGAMRPGSEEILLEIAQPNLNHNGGGLGFGPDGYLYLSVGDGGGGSDVHGHGQNTQTLLATMLRIDVDSGTPYGIPADNPFAEGVGGRPEIFAWGLRNTWRWSFDPLSGLLWGGDVGEKLQEEVNVIRRGGNYGWSRVEGDHCRTGSCREDSLLPPRHSYHHAAANVL